MKCLSPIALMDKFVFFNPNPYGRRVGDCAVRAVCKALNQSWDKTYVEMAVYGFSYGDMSNANSVWGKYLRDKGFTKHIIPDTCPDCYTLDDFCTEHPTGVYVIALSGHVVTVIDGKLYDTWDSGNEIPIYYWQKRKEE